MLNRQDRQRLAAIESELAEGDPRFAEKFDKLGDRRWLARRGFRRLLMGGIVFLGIVAAFCLVSGLPMSAITLGAFSALGAVLLRTGGLLPGRAGQEQDNPSAEGSDG